MASREAGIVPGVAVGVLNRYEGRVRPEVQPLTLLYTIFHEKAVPLSYTLY